MLTIASNARGVPKAGSKPVNERKNKEPVNMITQPANRQWRESRRLYALPQHLHRLCPECAPVQRKDLSGRFPAALPGINTETGPDRCYMIEIWDLVAVLLTTTLPDMDGAPLTAIRAMTYRDAYSTQRK